MYMTTKETASQKKIPGAFQEGFDEFHLNKNLFAIENLLTKYINSKLDFYLNILN